MSDSFDLGWLSLREPFDHAARAAAAIDAGSLRRADGQRPLRVVDLGCGTGSNLRSIAPKLQGRQHWRMVDHDPALLAALPDCLTRWAVEHGLRASRSGDPALLTIEGADDLHLQVESHCVDMALGLDAVPFAGADLVTASALLDLASAGWIDALVEHCRVNDAAVWWALSVDGRVTWSPSDPSDEWMLAQFHAHQQRDKGFGPALGADAATHAARSLRRSGYRVVRSPSDWQIEGQRSPADTALLRAMIEGMATAVAEQAPSMTARIAQWQATRLSQLSTLRLRVGHVDLMGFAV